MEEYFRIGVITSTHGIRGGVKVFPTTDSAERFFHMESCYLQRRDGSRQELHITGAKHLKNLVVLEFQEIRSVEEAEKLKNLELYIDRARAEKLEENEFYLPDLVGCRVYRDEDTEPFGQVEDFFDTGAGPILNIRDTEGGIHMVPAVPAFLKKAEPEKGEIRVTLIRGM